MTTIDRLMRVTAATDRHEAAARLAQLSWLDEYVVYEGPDFLVFAADPIGRIEIDFSAVRVSWDGHTSHRSWAGRPADALTQALKELPSDLRLFGWIGFEFSSVVHSGPRPVVADDNDPDANLLIAHLIVPRIEVRIDAGGASISGGTDHEVCAIVDLLRLPATTLPEPTPADVNVDPTDYRTRVATAVSEIHAGDYEKVILSRRLPLPHAVDIPSTYRLARVHNTPARSFLLHLGDLEAAGFSPEIVAAVDPAGQITTEPLAGTRAYGRGAAADEAARAELLRDPKEIVEHAVSVRTSVAEVASVAEAGSVVVSDFMKIRTRGSVQHLASTVRGELARGRTPWDAFEALFPAVTASGIPKRESVQAILRLDDSARGLYSGAVVMSTPDGGLEAALVLRAVYQQNGHAWLRAGAGVIAQSIPEREFEETCEKLSSVAPYIVRR